VVGIELPNEPSGYVISEYISSSTLLIEANDQELLHLRY
jgi:hypothetical protein